MNYDPDESRHVEQTIDKLVDHFAYLFDAGGMDAETYAKARTFTRQRLHEHAAVMLDEDPEDNPWYMARKQSQETDSDTDRTTPPLDHWDGSTPSDMDREGADRTFGKEVDVEVSGTTVSFNPHTIHTSNPGVVRPWSIQPKRTPEEMEETIDEILDDYRTRMSLAQEFPSGSRGSGKYPGMVTDMWGSSL